MSIILNYEKSIPNIHGNDILLRENQFLHMKLVGTDMDTLVHVRKIERLHEGVIRTILDFYLYGKEDYRRNSHGKKWDVPVIKDYMHVIKELDSIEFRTKVITGDISAIPNGLI